MGGQPVSERDPDEVLRFIERFATTLSEAGFARMPARVFVALLATDSGTLNTAEIDQLLHVSPAAVSGAVRYLTDLNMVRKEREPGARRDHYVLHDDTWYEIATRRERIMEQWISCCREGLAALGKDTPAGQRIAETLAYLEFVQEEVPGLLARWQKRRDELRATWSPR